MEIRAAGRPGRPNDKDINKTHEDKSSNKYKDQFTRHRETRINKTKHNQQDQSNHIKNNQQDQSNHIKNKDQEQNQHPAWNPDWRWSA